ncbi:hypothetical protein [Streptomyces sp. NPDC055085]
MSRIDALPEALTAVGGRGVELVVLIADADDRSNQELLCGVWLHEGKLGAARDMARQALDELEPHMDTADQTLRALWGAMHLRAAVCMVPALGSL